MENSATEASIRIKGVCKWFNDQKGYGFIDGSDGQAYFVHYSDIKGEGHLKLEPYQEVTFEPSKNAKGLRARGVSGG